MNDSNRAEQGVEDMAPGFRFGYYAGWADAKAGRQYGEGVMGRRLGTGHQPICAVVAYCGPHGEPLACGLPVGHMAEHSWASLPTFVSSPSLSGDDETPVDLNVGPD